MEAQAQDKAEEGEEEGTRQQHAQAGPVGAAGGGGGWGRGGCGDERHPHEQLARAQARTGRVLRRDGHGAQAAAEEPGPAHQGGGAREADPHAGGVRGQDLPAHAGARAQVRRRDHPVVAAAVGAGNHRGHRNRHRPGDRDHRRWRAPHPHPVVVVLWPGVLRGGRR
uniref:Uncharacterized protein n=1 Tax=Oryza glaberrima TaxID=4538 RepID=I1QLA5_ORYGL